MPFFDMKCNECEVVIEVLCSFEESEKELDCGVDKCVGKLIKQVSAPGGFEFNGLGCYHVEKHNINKR